MKPAYKKQLAFEPNKNDIFVVFNGHITRRFDQNSESKFEYPKTINLPDWIDASGKLHPGSGKEHLIRYNGKRFRTIR